MPLPLPQSLSDGIKRKSSNNLTADCGNKRLAFNPLPSSVCPALLFEAHCVLAILSEEHFFKRTNFFVKLGMNRFYWAVVLHYWLPPLFTEGETGSQLQKCYLEPPSGE